MTKDKNNKRTKNEKDMGETYGYEKIRLQDKQKKINEVFESVADKYDIMNDIMSMGIHRAWKDAVNAKANMPHKKPFNALDLAGGSGDIAVRLLKNAHPDSKITICDINTEMIEKAKEKMKRKNIEQQIEFVVADAQKLPFKDNSFDLCTIAFGMRNIPEMDKALKECKRIIKPACQFICLEFSQMDIPIIDKIYEYWSINAIPKWGKIIANDEDAYQYLVESIRRFPNQESFAQIIQNAGFKNVKYRNMSGGIVALHWGWKI